MSTNLVKTYKGAFTYLEANRAYSDETFEVFKNTADQSIQYQSEILTRVANGEFLKIKTLYQVNKEFLPQNVVIDKTLGSQQVQEVFSINPKDHVMTYVFITEDETIERQINLPPRFSIATPSACTSFLFFMGKKYDNTGKNFYNVFTSNNMWEFEDEPVQERLVVENPNNTPASIKLGDNTVTCGQYSLFTENDEDKQNPTIFYLSRHMGIPYRIVSTKQIKIEIKFLNHLEKDTNTYI